MAVPATEPAFSGRFILERKLGAGGFGSVYVALDRDRQTRVALKRLERLDAGSLYRFKQEFRALADVRHPNVVALHEFFANDGVWSFTMELLEGIRFDRYVRGEEPGALEPVAPTSTTGVPRAPDLRSDVTQPLLPPPPGPMRPAPCDLDRLRTALRGMVAGVRALHRAGLLHRDLKPSNVLVTPTGRAVILDFGLVATGVVDAHQSMEGRIAGTPAYMSPEQARGSAVSAASDLYAVGLMLYELLAGRPAFTGTAIEILEARVSRDPVDPRTLVTGLPDDLCDLAMALVARDPALRPSGDEVARRLGLDESLAEATTSASPNKATLVGREEELAILARAGASARSGLAVVAHIHGPSGLGKTALLRAFLARAATDGSTVILDGRCHDRESVPYKAVDEVMDALGRFLQRLPPIEAAGLMPRDGRALLRLFPTLGRLDFFASLPGREPTADPQELRRRAFSALRELLARLCDTAPVIISIDDVQWGDVDSAALLSALVAPPDPPPVLLIITSRGDDSVEGDIARSLRALVPGVSCHEVVDLPLGPLRATEAQTLARSLLGDQPPPGVDTAAVALESGGNPLFVTELCRALAAGRRAEAVTLPAVLGERISALPDGARSVLQALVCAGRPEGEAILAAVADLEPASAAEAFGLLRHEHLIGVVRLGGRSAFDVLHDQVRAAVLGAMEPTIRQKHHRRLAAELERAGTDFEALAQHYVAAGQPDLAGRHAERAGDRASEIFALDHAVRLYRLALEVTRDADRPRLHLKLADALAAAGRGAEAAAAYLAHAATISSDDGAADTALQLRRKAAEQFLRAGRITQGLDAAEPVFAATDTAMPRTPGRALAMLLYWRARLKLRGYGFEERPESSVRASQLRKMDLLWAFGNGLGGIDLVRSAYFQARHTAMALDAGEPYRIVRAFSIGSILSAIESMPGVERARPLAAKAAEVADRIGHPHARGWATAAQAIIRWSESDFTECVRLSEAATVLLREAGRDVFREIGSLQVWFNLHSQFLLGDLQQTAVRATACVVEAQARGDRYTETTARLYIVPLVHLALDQPAGAQAEADAAIEVWGQGGFHHQHWAELRARCCVDLYLGQGARAVERIEACRQAMKESLLLRIRTPRLEHTYFEGRGLLDSAWDTAHPGPKLHGVDRTIARLEAEHNRLASAYATSLRAGRVARAGNGTATRAAFAAAEAAFAALRMPLFAAAALRRQAEAAGGDTSAETIAKVDRILSSAGVLAPERFARFLAPRAI